MSSTRNQGDEIELVAAKTDKDDEQWTDEAPESPSPCGTAVRRRSAAPAGLVVNLSKPLISQSRSTGDLIRSPNEDGGPATRRGSIVPSPGSYVPLKDAFDYARRRRSITASWDYTEDLKSKIEDVSYQPPAGQEVGEVPIVVEAGVVAEVDAEKAVSATEPDDAPPDGGYGWIIVLVSFLVHFFTLGGILYTFGIFQRYYLANNVFPGATSLQISFIGSIGSAAMPGFGPISGRLADKYGYRLMVLIGSILVFLAMLLASFSTSLWQFMLTEGLMYGIGMSLTYLPNIASVPQWFSKKRGMAVGMAVSGAGLGGLAMSAVVQALLERLGYPWTLRVLGILGSAAGLTSALLLRTRVPPKPRGPWIAWYLFKDFNFATLFTSSFLGAFGYFIPFFYIPSYAVANGMTPAQGALAVSLLNGASAAGRIFQGLVADIYLGPFNSFVLCQFLAPLSTLLIWPFSTSFGLLVFYAVFLGINVGGFISLFPVVLTQIFGTDGVATVVGTQSISGLVGNLAGPPIAGLLFEATGKYLSLQLFSALTMLTAGVLILVVRMKQANRKILVKL